MTLSMRRIGAALAAALMAASAAACKAPPKHSDSTKGTKQERSDTGMHGGAM